MSECSIWTLDGASQIIHLTTGQTARDAHRSTLCYIVEFCRRRSPLPPPSLPPTFSRPPHHSLARWGFSRLKPPPLPPLLLPVRATVSRCVSSFPPPPPCLTVVVAGCLAAVWFEGALDGSGEGGGRMGTPSVLISFSPYPSRCNRMVAPSSLSEQSRRGVSI